MAIHVIQRQARLWHATRESASADVARSDREANPAVAELGWWTKLVGCGEISYGWRGRADGSPLV